eukprot:UN26479
MMYYSSWPSLSSPAHDMENAIEVFGKLGLKLYCFINLTADQMNDVSKRISTSLGKNSVYYFITVVMVDI